MFPWRVGYNVCVISVRSYKGVVAFRAMFNTKGLSADDADDKIGEAGALLNYFLSEKIHLDDVARKINWTDKEGSRSCPNRVWNIEWRRSRSWERCIQISEWMKTRTDVIISGTYVMHTSLIFVYIAHSFTFLDTNRLLDTQ